MVNRLMGLVSSSTRKRVTLQNQIQVSPMATLGTQSLVGAGELSVGVAVYSEHCLL